MERILTWFFSGAGAETPAYYMERAYEPKYLRIHADIAPALEDLIADIKDDGVSIMAPDNNTVNVPTYTHAMIEYITLAVSKFSKGETITGGTSSSTAKVYSDNGIGSMVLDRDPEASAAFTVSETITGGTSGATAVVAAYVARKWGNRITTTIGLTGGNLVKGTTESTIAEDFPSSSDIQTGSWLTCSIPQSGGAKNITVQLELESLDETIEE